MLRAWLEDLYAALGQAATVNAGTLAWTNLFGGAWGTPTNWLDTLAGTIATPTLLSAVVIAGGVGDNFTNIIGTGTAAQASISGDVLLWGTVGINGGLALAAAGELDLDGGANVRAAGLALAGSAALVAENSSTVAVTGAATLANGLLLAAGGSSIRLAGLIANGLGLNTGVVAVDDSSTIEIGSAGGAALGAITIDGGQSTAISGALQGNVVVNGTLAVQAGGVLAIDQSDPFGSGQTITGTGTLQIGEGSQLILGVADSAAIQFAAPAGTLVASAIPSGQISGFASGDTIALVGGLGTALRFTQTTPNLATLTLLKGATVGGRLTLAGNYATSMFHLRLSATGTAYITMQTVGTAPSQPSLLYGTAGSDMLTATANNQVLTGRGGADSLSGGVFTGVTFRDSSANLNGSTITGLSITDTIDLLDIKPGSAAVTFTPATYSPSAPPIPASLVVNDGTASATMTLMGTEALPAGIWTAAADGTGGTLLKYTVLNVDAYTFSPLAGDSMSVVTNWRDTTAGATAKTAPGAGNAVTLAGGSSYANVAGTAVAASLTVTGDVLLLGTVNVASSIPGVSGALTQSGTFALDNAASVRLGGTAMIGGVLLAGGASRLTASSLAGSGATIVATGASAIQFGTVASAPSLTLATDATSSIEFGAVGGAKAGALSIDAGIVANLAGTIDSNVVVSGTLVASGHSLAIAPFGQGTSSVSGTGLLEIDGGGTLALGALDSVPIMFTATGGTLALGGSFPTGVVSGFGTNDLISIGRPVTAIAYSGTGALSFLNAGSIVGTMSIAGSYTAQQFQLLVAPNGLSASVVFAPTPNATTGSQISTGSSVYTWNNGGGTWSNGGNWIDGGTGRAAMAGPGGGDPVVIQNGPGVSAQQVIAGSGAAASLQVNGSANVIFTGTLTIGGQFYAATSRGSNVALASGAQIAAASFSDYSSVTISGGSTLTVSGTGGGGTTIVGGLAVVGGSSVKSNGGLDIGGGTLGVDATSLFEAGAAGGSASGTVTIDAGQTATIEENGTIAGRMVVNGLLTATNATIQGFGGTAGAISGIGTIAIGSLTGPGRLTLRSPDSVTLLMNQPGDILEIQGSLPTGAISGFAGTDTIQVDQTVTGVSFKQTTSLQGTLTLTNGAATVGSLTLLGNYAGSQFQLDVAAPTGFGTISLLPTPAAGVSSAATLTVSRYTLLAGQTTVSGALAVVGGKLALAAAVFTASTATIAGTLQAGAASSIAITNTATLMGGVLAALSGSTIQLGGLLGGGSGNVLAVDANSAIRIGTSSGVAGAVTLGAGTAAVLNGSIYGNVMVNGTLVMPGGGSLFIDMTGVGASDPYLASSSIGGTGTLAISQGGMLALGSIDTAPIQFNGPNGTLMLASIPSGKISGFYAGDQIVLNQPVTAISYTQITSTAAALLLRNGSAMVGTLNLGGNFAGNLFHLDTAANGACATITLQTLGLAATQPTLIQGTNLAESLTATANGQTIIGGGGSDTLNGAGFGSLMFKDTVANFTTDTILNFSTSDTVDLTDLSPGSATVQYVNGIVAVSGGSRSGGFALSFATPPAAGTFHTATDGGSGTRLTWS